MCPRSALVSSTLLACLFLVNSYTWMRSPSGHEYFASSHAKWPYDWAEQFCQENNATLPIYSSADESRWVEQNVANASSSFLAIDNFKRSQLWFDGSKVNYTSWERGSPKSTGRCSKVLLVKSGFWKDEPCDSQAERVVCLNYTRRQQLISHELDGLRSKNFWPYKWMSSPSSGREYFVSSLAFWDFDASLQFCLDNDAAIPDVDSMNESQWVYEKVAKGYKFFFGEQVVRASQSANLGPNCTQFVVDYGGERLEKSCDESVNRVVCIKRKETMDIMIDHESEMDRDAAPAVLDGMSLQNIHDSFASMVRQLEAKIAGLEAKQELCCARTRSLRSALMELGSQIS